MTVHYELPTLQIHHLRTAYTELLSQSVDQCCAVAQRLESVRHLLFVITPVAAQAVQTLRWVLHTLVRNSHLHVFEVHIFCARVVFKHFFFWSSLATSSSVAARRSARLEQPGNGLVITDNVWSVISNRAKITDRMTTLSDVYFLCVEIFLLLMSELALALSSSWGFEALILLTRHWVHSFILLKCCNHLAYWTFTNHARFIKQKPRKTQIKKRLNISAKTDPLCSAVSLRQLTY